MGRALQVPGVAGDAPRSGRLDFWGADFSSRPGGNREGATAVALVHPHATAVAWGPALLVFGWIRDSADGHLDSCRMHRGRAMSEMGASV